AGEKLSAAEVAEALPALFPDRDLAELREHARRFASMFTRSIYKWVQAPLSVHIGALDLERERALQLPVVQQNEWGEVEDEAETRGKKPAKRAADAAPGGRSRAADAASQDNARARGRRAGKTGRAAGKRGGERRRGRSAPRRRAQQSLLRYTAASPYITARRARATAWHGSATPASPVST